MSGSFLVAFVSCRWSATHTSAAHAATSTNGQTRPMPVGAVESLHFTLQGFTVFFPLRPPKPAKGAKMAPSRRFQLSVSHVPGAELTSASANLFVKHALQAAGADGEGVGVRSLAAKRAGLQRFEVRHAKLERRLERAMTKPPSVRSRIAKGWRNLDEFEGEWFRGVETGTVRCNLQAERESLSACVATGCDDLAFVPRLTTALCCCFQRTGTSDRLRFASTSCCASGRRTERRRECTTPPQIAWWRLLLRCEGSVVSN